MPNFFWQGRVCASLWKIATLEKFIVQALYESLDNAIYSKTMENLRNRIDVNLENKEKKPI